MNSLVNEIKKAFIEEKQSLYEAIGKDYKENNIKIDYSRLENIIENLDKEILNNNASQRRTVVIVYNGNIYVMLEATIKSMINNNNTILIIENEKELYTSKKMLDIIQKIALKRTLILKEYGEVDTKNILTENTLINRIIYLGDRRNYRQLKAKTDIDIMYNGYGSINVYVDDEDEFEDELYAIEEYASANNLYVYKQTEDISEAIGDFNEDGKNDICVILSKDTEKINEFKEKIQATNILINDVDFTKIKQNIPNELFS